ncbi:toxin-antitoxin system YwqK family antitoxin [Pinibacter soli]|uniref:Toxin-antitoxin system YwqK family antitoxin n=1 Tax=Pinibacter soli TaxID=3044211 RepID=A0ABT6R8S1_9BACT|nr:hypothetical protein [Pinibacter soli]MDI3318284.1 hypothetical protein [Pinibacter soli]
MIQTDKQTFALNSFCKAFSIILTIVIYCSCNSQSSEDAIKSVDTNPKVAPESLHFIAHIVENNSDGTKSEIDTLTGYRKYFYANGKLQMEGKVTKASPKDYRDGIWNYYNDAGQLMKQETSTQEGKVNELNFMYFKNGKPLSKTYQYYEGNYKDRANFKFHKIETLFYTNGQELSERHSINGSIVEEKCWDSKGNPKPIEYLKTIKSVEAND